MFTFWTHCCMWAHWADAASLPVISDICFLSLTHSAHPQKASHKQHTARSLTCKTAEYVSTLRRWCKWKCVQGLRSEHETLGMLLEDDLQRIENLRWCDIENQIIKIQEWRGSDLSSKEEGNHDVAWCLTWKYGGWQVSLSLQQAHQWPGATKSIFNPSIDACKGLLLSILGCRENLHIFLMDLSRHS